MCAPHQIGAHLFFPSLNEKAGFSLAVCDYLIIDFSKKGLNQKV
jgi:hypothetical protein